jgi:hypothetical protein
MLKRSASAKRLARFIGKPANLLLLHENSAENIEAYDGIVKVILRGQVLDREGLRIWPQSQPRGAGCGFHVV